MKIIKKILIVLLIALVLIQFYRPEKNNAEYRDVGSFESDTKVTPEIKAILEQNCYDCHSNKTNYPWYAEIAPFSIAIAHHIEEGNEHLNFSKWDSYTVKKKDHKLDELIEEVEEGEMPLKSYTITHGDLTDSQQAQMIAWAKQVRANYNIK